MHVFCWRPSSNTSNLKISTQNTRDPKVTARKNINSGKEFWMHQATWALLFTSVKFKEIPHKCRFLFCHLQHRNNWFLCQNVWIYNRWKEHLRWTMTVVLGIFIWFLSNGDTFKVMKLDLPRALVHRSPVVLRRCCPVSSQSCHFWGTAMKLFVPDSRQPHCRALVSCYIKY